MTDEKKKCFIVMPITTPEPMREKYRDGAEHFNHVLKCLFIPAIEKAGYVPVPPIAKGADLIHAEIIRNLESSELVLCDISCLNANVFFEFGIRTSLNKPVCVVKDELTKRVPFDTAILNYQEYRSSLEPWELDSEIGKLAGHLTESDRRSKGENTLWRHLGLKSQATSYQGEAGADAKLDYINLQIESLKQKIDAMEAGEGSSAPRLVPSSAFEMIDDLVPVGAKVLAIHPVAGTNEILVAYKGEISVLQKEIIKNRVSGEYNLSVRLVSV